MLTLISLSFWLYFLYFIFVVFIAFFIPGTLLLKNIKLNIWQSSILSIIVGMVLWCWQGFIFGFLGFRWLTYIYLIGASFIWLKFNFRKFHNLKIPNIKNCNLLLISILLIGMVVQILSTFFVGMMEREGMYFCCGLPDSLYHLALTNQIVRQFPPIEPGASGIIVANYHYWGNILSAELVRVFNLPLISTQYQYLVLLFSFLFGLVPLVFAQIIKANKKFTYWLLLFLYFSGDLTYILLLILDKGLNFNLPFLENGSWLWISPPRVMATVIFFGALSLFTIWLKKKNIYLGILVALMFSSLIGFKVYFGFFILSGLGFLGIYYFLKKEFTSLFPLVLTVFLSAFIYLLVSSNSGGLIFTGLWRFQDFIVSPLFNLSHLELERQIYLTHFNWPRLIEYAIIYTGIYFIFVFGSLNLGWLQTKKSLNVLNKELNIFLISGIFLSLIIGSFFIQSIGGANSSQFLITVEIIASIYAALAASYWTQKVNKKFGLIMILVILSLTLPRVVYESYKNIQLLSNKQGFMISNQELQALDYLKNNTSKKSLILVDNIDKGHWRNAFSYYISFLSDRQIVVDGNGIAQDHSVLVEDKIMLAKNVFESSDSALVQKLLYENKINYLYMQNKDNLKVNEIENYLIPVFQNTEVKIFKVANKSVN